MTFTTIRVHVLYKVFVRSLFRFFFSCMCTRMKLNYTLMRVHIRKTRRCVRVAVSLVTAVYMPGLGVWGGGGKAKYLISGFSHFYILVPATAVATDRWRIYLILYTSEREPPPRRSFRFLPLMDFSFEVLTDQYERTHKTIYKCVCVRACV